MSRNLAFILVLACTLGACASDDAVPAEAGSPRSAVPAGINARFLDPDLDARAWVDRWEVESREVYVARRHIVAACGLREGDRIADVGAGTGLFMEPFARAVGDTGRVLEVEIAPRFVDHLRRRAREEGHAKVEIVASTETSTELPPDSVECVFVCDTYHHFEYHRAMLASIHSALRPGGRLVIVDFERIPGVSRPWILGHVRCGKDQVRREVEEAGFVFEDELEVPRFHENYLLRFRIPGQSEPRGL
ncbi:MAG: methyltransferase domain-containing protein [Planctomycetota bacterium]